MNSTVVRGTLLALSLGILGGCSSMSSIERETFCVAGGTLIGGGIGASSSSEDAAKGALGGALAGALICHLMDGDAAQDGVNDSEDQCPATPQGAAVDSVGCELEVVVEPVVIESVDGDGDLVVDASDLCPNTPAGVTVDVNGCPVVTLNDISFAFDSDVLNSDAAALLSPQIELLQNNPALGLKITGYTDSTGPAEYNQTLSLRRAEAIRDFFVRNGLPASTFTVAGEGESNPIASNQTSEGRAENRRVVLSVSSQ